MKIEWYFSGGYIVVHREPTDKKYYGVKGAAGESRFLYDLKKELNSIGFDLIKKRMAKDGHLVNEMQQYLRARIPIGNPNLDIAIYNDMWAIRGADVCFNEGSVRLALVGDYFNSGD